MMNNNEIFSWYESAMHSVGRKVSFPRADDKTKTYLWRQLEAFSKKMSELEIDDDLAHKIVDIIVQYAKDHKLLNRGASILAKADLIEICHNKLKDEVRVESRIVNEIERSFLFLGKQQSRIDCNEILLNKRRINAYANITCWFQEGKLSKSFVALSSECYAAISKLNDDEREEFPSDAEIIKIRYKLLKNKSISPEVKKIMGTDLATGGVG